MKQRMRVIVLGMLLGGIGSFIPMSVIAAISTTEQGVQVLRIVPADMSADVPADTSLTVEFTGAVSQAFYQTINLNLLKNGQLIDGELFYNPSARQVMFKPKTTLQPGQMYTAQLSFTDNNNGMAEKVWNFRVANRSSAAQTSNAFSTVTNPSKLIITNATMSGGMMDSQSPLEISFSEPLDIASLKDAPVQLLRNQEVVGVDYRLSRDLKTITLVPRKQLLAGSDYQIAVNRSLAGVSGSRLQKSMLIPFQIGNITADYPVPANVLEESPADTENSNQDVNSRRTLVNTTGFGISRSNVRESSVPLKLVAMSPQNGAVVNNLSQPITIAFNQEVRPETLNEFTFRVEDEFGPIPAKIQYLSGQKRAVLTPLGVLDANRSYRVIITQGITDMVGKPLEAGNTSTFATGAPGATPSMPKYFATVSNSNSNTATRKQPSKNMALREPIQESRELESLEKTSKAYDLIEGDADWNDTIPVTRSKSTSKSRPVAPKEPLSTFKVTGILPAANAEQVARDAKIYIHFNEAADVNTLNSINISVFGKQERVDGRVSYDAAKKRAIFTPLSLLDTDTQYKVLVSNKIKSKAGEPLTARYSWQFTTQNERQARKNVINRPRQAEADAAFYIPLADGRNSVPKAVRTQQTSPSTTTGFVYVPANHWTFKSLKHIVSKGILPSSPFSNDSKVTRYEFASAVKSALDNLRNMNANPKKPTLKVGDLVELEQLVIAYRGELRSFAVDVSWFENFLSAQGVSIADIERRVNMNGEVL